VQQLFSLALDGPDHLRMAVARGIDGYPGGKIKKNIAVDIIDP
jgi:hypothetical protein